MIEILNAIFDIFSANFILLVVSAFLFSIYGLKAGEIKQEFLSKRYSFVVLILGALFFLVFIYDYWKFYNTPLVHCIGWEEFCSPFISAINYELSLFIFVIALLTTTTSISGVPADRLWKDILDKRKKKSKIGNTIKFIGVLALYVFATLGFMFGSSFVFSEEPKQFQPLTFINEHAHDTNYDFYFKNNSNDEKLITKIEFEFPDSSLNYTWDSSNCSGLPAIIPKGEIKKISCEHGDYSKCSCEGAKRVTAYTYGEHNYPTVFKP